VRVPLGLGILLLVYFFKSGGILATNPHRILLVYAVGPWSHPLREYADGHETAENREGFLFSNIYSPHETLVTVGHCLDWVIPKFGEHPVFEGAYDTLGAADGANIICWCTADLDRLGLADIGVLFASFADPDALDSQFSNVS